MPKAYSLDLRQRVVAACDEGEIPVTQIAVQFRVKRWWVYKLLRQRRETGSIAPRKGKTGPKPKLANYREHLREAIENTPDATLEELRDQLGLSVGLTTLWRALEELKVTLKKSPVRRRTTTT